MALYMWFAEVSTVSLPKHTQPVQDSVEGGKCNGSDRGDCCRERRGVRLITLFLCLLQPIKAKVEF